VASNTLEIRARCKTLVQDMGAVVEVSAVPIKWGHHAETPEAQREVEESAATRISEGLKTNRGVLGGARVGSQTMGGGRNAPTS
jgi:hypothetical protein